MIDEEREKDILETDEMWNILLQMGVSEEVLSIVTTINGYNQTTMEDILYAKFGYRKFSQLD